MTIDCSFTIYSKSSRSSPLSLVALAKCGFSRPYEAGKDRMSDLFSYACNSILKIENKVIKELYYGS